MWRCVFLLVFFLSSPVEARDKINVGIVKYNGLMSEIIGEGVMTDIVTAAFDNQGVDVSYTIYPTRRITRVLEGRECVVIAG